MSCDADTGRLLAQLAARYPGGRLLELGTGFGVGTAWLFSGMDSACTLTTVELDPDLPANARRTLDDQRVTFVSADGGYWLACYDGPRFDLVFADTWPGKFTHLEPALELVAVGGTYVIDDLTVLAGWSTRHRTAVEELVEHLQSRDDFHAELSNRSTGWLVATRVAASGAGSGMIGP